MANSSKNSPKQGRGRRKTGGLSAKRRTRAAAIEAMSDEEVEASIEAAIRKLLGKLAADGVKGSVTDLIRLLQMRREIAVQHPHEVLAGWTEKDPWAETPNGD